MNNGQLKTNLRNKRKAISGLKGLPEIVGFEVHESLALASMARDDSPANSTVATSSKASSTAPASSTAVAMRGKVGSECET